MKKHGDAKEGGFSGKGFTLIELLVVVAVILILLGISLKVMNVVGRKTATARTLYVLEQTRNALDAYYASVGSYPNTTTVKYKHNVGNSPMDFDASAELKAFEVKGLTYYIGYESRPRSETWQKFSRTVIGNVGGGTNPPIKKVGFSPVKSTNSVESINDGWNQEIIYDHNENCDGYTIYSKGPTGDPADDVGIDKNE